MGNCWPVSAQGEVSYLHRHLPAAVLLPVTEVVDWASGAALDSAEWGPTPRMPLRFHRWAIDQTFIAAIDISWIAAHIAVVCQRQVLLHNSSL